VKVCYYPQEKISNTHIHAILEIAKFIEQSKFWASFVQFGNLHFNYISDKPTIKKEKDSPLKHLYNLISY
jgi:hypothetical protein